MAVVLVAMRPEAGAIENVGCEATTASSGEGGGFLGRRTRERPWRRHSRPVRSAQSCGLDTVVGWGRRWYKLEADVVSPQRLDALAGGRADRGEKTGCVVARTDG